MIEHWKPVPSKPGITASSLGRIKLPNSVVKMPFGGVREYKPKATYGTKTKASKTARHEYMGIVNRKFGNMKIHRLVCEAFYGLAPFERAVVIHIDEDATNNRIENLRWGTQKENLNMPKFIEYCKSRTGENSSVKKGKKAKL
jgi:hypothetical protein